MKRDISLIGDEAELRGSPRVAGLDLAARSSRCSGYALINASSRVVERVQCLYTDEEILSVVLRDKPRVLAIDAPISPSPRWREVDRLARRAGFRVMPPTLGPMRELTLRAWRLYENLSSLGVEVIETHPSSVLLATSVESLAELLLKLGLSCRECYALTRDLADAILAAIAAYCYSARFCAYAVVAGDGAIHLARL
ncbi:MAG: hypothetical protein QXF57_02720 [Acidilobaceae archaeon]